MSAPRTYARPITHPPSGPDGQTRRDTAWMERAACVGIDAEIFFPRMARDIEPALQVCATCPVLDECSAFGDENSHLGVWGGTLRRRSWEGSA